MSFKHNIRRFFRNIEIENLMTYCVATMIIIFVGNLMTGGQIGSFLNFDRDLILEGQVWRVLTFLFIPQSSGALGMVFYALFYYWVGKELDEQWGAHNVTMYFLTGSLMLIAIGFITGHTSAHYLYLSMFLVYANLDPNHQIRLQMLIPIEVKWLALIDVVFMLVDFFDAFKYYPVSLLRMFAIGTQLSVLAAFGTFLIFRGRPYFERIANKFKHRNFINEMRRHNIKVNSSKDEDDE